jgi:hypothetical protein
MRGSSGGGSSSGSAAARDMIHLDLHDYFGEGSSQDQSDFER